MMKRIIVSLLFFFTFAYAGYDVSPTRIYLTKANPVATLTVSNHDQEDVSFQLETMRWRQDANGTDEYAESDDLLVVPPLFTLSGDSSQVVRIMATKKPQNAEGSYRLFVNEIPKRSSRDGAHINMVFRISLPVFVSDGSAETSELNITDVERHADALTFTLENRSAHFVRVSVVSARSAEGKKSAQIEPVKYILSGSKARFTLPLETDFVPRHLNIQLDNGQSVEMDI